MISHIDGISWARPLETGLISPVPCKNFANALRAEWGKIPQYRVRALCRAMDRRVVAGRRAYGGRTLY